MMDTAFLLELIKLNTTILSALSAIKDGLQNNEVGRQKVIEMIDGISRNLSALQLNHDHAANKQDEIRQRMEVVERELERLVATIRADQQRHHDQLTRIETATAETSRIWIWIEQVGKFTGSRIADVSHAITGTRIGQLVLFLFSIGLILRWFGPETVDAAKSLLGSWLNPNPTPITDIPTPKPEAPP